MTPHTPPHWRPFDALESAFMLGAAERTKAEVDAELGELFERLAHNDDGALPATYDRLNVLGRFGDADRLRRMVEGR